MFNPTPNSVDRNFRIGTLAELAKLQAGSPPPGLLDKAKDIANHMLARADVVLRQLGHPTPHIGAVELGVVEHGLHLVEWAKAQTADPDTLEGRMIQVIRLCGHAMMQFENGIPETLLGFILGYGLAQNYFLAFREYEDGPALARERESAKGRTEGGRQRAKSIHAERAPDKERARAAFAARTSPLSAKGWAERNAQHYAVSARTLRRWLAG